jgi:hypothetical protein
MKQITLIAFAIIMPTAVMAQGVNDPSTPNRGVIVVNPPQPSRSTATPNIPSTIQAPVTRGGRAQPYHGRRTRTSGSSRY